MSERTYKIGEVAELLNLKSYVLRFWEIEFTQLNPTRTEKGQRFYTEEDIQLLKLIKHMLHERGLTIEGARRALKDKPAANSAKNNQKHIVTAASAPEKFGAGQAVSINSNELLSSVLADLKTIRDLMIEK